MRFCYGSFVITNFYTLQISPKDTISYFMKNLKIQLLVESFLQLGPIANFR